MSPINQTQYPEVTTSPNQFLERESNARDASDGFKHRDPNIQPLFLFCVLHPGHKPVHHLGVGDRKRVLDFHTPDWPRLLQRRDRLLDSPVHGIEVDDRIPRLEDQVPENGVHARRGVFDEHAVCDGGVEVVSYGGAGLVEEDGLLVPDEWVRAGFGEVLVFLESFGCLYRVRAEGAWGWLVVSCVRSFVWRLRMRGREYHG